MKKILKQDSNSRQRQAIVPVSKLKARNIKTLLLLPIHLAHHRFTAADFAPMLLHSRCCRSCCRSCHRSCCCYDVAPLLLRFRFYQSVAPAVAPAVDTLSLLLLPLLSLHCNSCCRSDVALLSLCCRSAVALLSLCCRSGVAPLSLRYQSAVSPLSSSIPWTYNYTKRIKDGIYQMTKFKSICKSQ